MSTGCKKDRKIGQQTEREYKQDVRKIVQDPVRTAKEPALVNPFATENVDLRTFFIQKNEP